MKTKNKLGYIYLDVLVGLLIFGIGMIACLQINNDFVRHKAENANYLKAIQIAASTMDEMVEGYKERSGAASVFLHNEVINEIDEKFERKISIEKDEENDLLKITVRIKWIEREEPCAYSVETEIADEGKFYQ